jgi:hypothetical protein
MIHTGKRKSQPDSNLEDATMHASSHVPRLLPFPHCPNPL